MKMNYRAALFDLDGTLIDSLKDIADAMNHVLQQRALPTYAYADYCYMVGNGMKVLTERALPKGADAQLVNEVLQEMMQYYAMHLVEKTTLYDGIAELLDRLVAQEVKIVILSNKPDHLVRKIASKLMAKWPLAVVRGAIEGIPRKPDPTSALNIASELGIEPDKFIYFGDTNVDMETATKAGMYAIGVTWGFRTEKELRESGAQTILHHPDEWTM